MSAQDELGLVERLLIIADRRRIVSLPPDAEDGLRAAAAALTSLIAERDAAETSHTAARENFLTMQGAAAQLLKRAEAAEAQLKAARDVLTDCATIMPRYRLAGKTLVEDEEFSALLERVNETLVLVP